MALFVTLNFILYLYCMARLVSDILGPVIGIVMRYYYLYGHEPIWGYANLHRPLALKKPKKKNEMNSLSTLHVRFSGEKLKLWSCYRVYDNASV